MKYQELKNLNSYINNFATIHYTDKGPSPAEHRLVTDRRCQWHLSPPAPGGTA